MRGWRGPIAALTVALVALAAPADAAFAYYKTATLAAAQAGSVDSTDWPLAIALDDNVQAADADLKSTGNGGYVQSTSGYDIRPHANATCSSALTFELVYYQATTGKLEMHVKIPTLSASVNTVIYLCYGDATLTTDGSSTGTWVSAYKAVWHMQAGTSATDSTANGNNAAPSTGGTPAAAAAQIQNGSDFERTESDYFDAGTSATLEMQTIAASCWINAESWSAATTTNQILTKVTTIAAGGWEFGIRILATPTQRAAFAYYDGSIRGWYEASTSLSTATRYHVVAIRDQAAGNVKFYLNGAADGVVAATSGTIAYSADMMQIGKDAATNAYWDGLLDECRLNNTVLTASWIVSDYNSQKTSSTFITWGSQTALATSSGGLTLRGAGR